MNSIYTSLKNDSTEASVAAGKKAKGGKSLKKRVQTSLASASLAVSAAVAMASSHQALANEAASSSSYQVGASGSANTPDSLLQAGESEINAAPSNVVDQATDTNGDLANLTAGLDDTAKNNITSGNAAGTGTSNVKATRLLGSSADTGGSSQLLGAGLLQATTAADTSFGGPSGTAAPVHGRYETDVAVTQGPNSIALGRGSVAVASGVAIGVLSEVTGLAGLAVGLSASASTGVAIGPSAVVVNGTALGVNATGTGNSAVALGTNTTASGVGAIVLGSFSISSGAYTTIVGASSTASGANATALGPKTTASADNSVALGGSSIANRNYTVSVGSSGAERQITNVKAGTELTDAVNVAQLNSLGLMGATAVGLDNSASVNGRTDTTAAAVTGLNALAFGRGSLGAFNSVAVGTLSQADSNATAVGYGAMAASASVAIGVRTSATGATSIAMGTQASASGASSIGLGNFSNASGAMSVALGAYSTATADGATALGNYSIANRADTVSVGSAGSERQVVNVAAGTESTDAVNVSQLKAVGMTTDAGGTITNAFVAYDDTTKNTIKLGGTAGTIIGNVKAGVDQNDAVNVAQLNAAGLVIGTDGTISNAFVAYDDTLKDTITLGGTDGTVIGNVKAGALTATSREAVNGSQLFDTSSRMAAMLGGGASVDPSGALLAPTYKVGGTEVHDVGSAIGNLDGRVTQNSSDIAGILGALASGSGSTPTPTPTPTPDSNPTSNPASNPNAISYDSADRDQVTLGGFNVAAAPVKLANVAAGELSSSSADAVNGAQLSATNVRVSATENAIAGYQAAGLEFVIVNSSTDSSGSKPLASGQDSIAIGSNAQASGKNSVAIGANSVADDANTVSVGSADNERRVTNVAAGTKGTDAANVNQLNKLREDVGADMRSLQRSAYSGVAAAMAMPNLMPSAPGKVVMAAGVGNFKGYGAFGAGATYRSDDGKWLMNGAVSLTGNGDAGVRAQVGYEF